MDCGPGRTHRPIVLIGLVSVVDGTLRPLKSVDWRGVNKMVFSADGRFIAYDLAVTEPRPQAQILVMAVDGSREHVVIDDPSESRVMGWAADGHLVFASNRSGALSLWVARVEDGRAMGAPRLVKENIGSVLVARDDFFGNALYLEARQFAVRQNHTIDLPSGKLLDADAGGFQRFIESRGRPSWSADGKHFVYISCGPTGGGPCALFLGSTETGAVRQIPHPLRYLGFPRLAPDGHAVVTGGNDAKGRNGIYVIDAASGATSLLAPFDQVTRPRDPHWSPDGRAIGIRRPAAGTSSSSSATSRRNRRRKSSGRPRMVASVRRISPDGRLVGYVRDDATGRASTFMVMPRSGGAATAVFGGGRLGFYWQWLPDSRGSWSRGSQHPRRRKRTCGSSV